jgi:tetratricopeptide (TPR) repeat protein
MRFAKKLFLLAGIILWFGTVQLQAQDETPAEKAYREDYEQFQKIQAVKEPLKRADELLAFIQSKPQSKLQPNAQSDYLMILDEFRKTEKWDILGPQAERFIKIRPRVGETYYYLGLALNAQKKFDEAMIALAKCYLLQNPGSTKARTFLEMIWKGRHAGKLDGLDAFIAKIRQGLV